MTTIREAIAEQGERARLALHIPTELEQLIAEQEQDARYENRIYPEHGLTSLDALESQDEIGGEWDDPTADAALAGISDG